MNDKPGAESGAHRRREPFWRAVDADRTLRSPDQEFETSGNYREPPEDWAERGEEQPGGFAGRGPKRLARTDERIREDVCERLSWNEEIDATEIEVRVENGEVVLEGSVEERAMKQLAEDLAERVPGVIEVRNGIRVKRGGP